MYEYNTEGTCASSIHFDVENGKMHNVEFFGGCNGNLKAIGKLVEGMDAKECIEKLKGLRCNSKKTSCADQLVQGIEAALKQNAS
jgi:uncharacterized protein (TIGR03905 family)